MAEPAQKTTETEAEPAKKRSKLPLIIGVILALLGGAGGYFVVQSGLLGGKGSGEQDVAAAEPAEEMPALAFIPLESLVINLPSHAQAKHLLFTAQLEVTPAYQEEVRALTPRIVDVLNGYLRAVRVSELEDPTALIRLRAQMLRRVQVVVGDGRVRDLLVMEFVLN